MPDLDQSFDASVQGPQGSMDPQTSFRVFMEWFRTTYPVHYNIAMQNLTSSNSLSLGRAGLGPLSGLGDLTQDRIDNAPGFTAPTRSEMRAVNSPRAWRGGIIGGLGNLGDDIPTPPVSQTSSWLDTLKSVAAPLLATYQQQQLFKMNVERAKNGQPPLSSEQFATGVKVGLDPSTQQMLTYGGIGLLAILAFGMLKKR
jgi:hypothetical protein